MMIVLYLPVFIVASVFGVTEAATLREGRIKRPSHKEGLGVRVDDGAASIDNHKSAQDFETITAALVNGYRVDYAVDLTRCSTQDGSERVTRREIIGGPVETFEYFWGERFGPVPYWGSSLSEIVLVEDEEHVRELSQIRLYANETVRVRIVRGALETSEFQEYDVMHCSLNDGPGGGEVFTIHEPLEQLTSYDDLLSALYAGSSVRFSVHYYSCGPSPEETISGAALHSYDVNSAQDEITFHGGELIVNYYITDDGFLYNGSSGVVSRGTSRVEFRPWGLEYGGTWDVRYVSFYDCALNDGTVAGEQEGGGIFFYVV